MFESRFFFHALLVVVLLALNACATNPVTGTKELAFVSESQEIALGEKGYRPAQQTQGGTYVVDPELTAYVARVGKKLAQVSDRPNLPYEFVVLNNSVPNAWAMPGGKIAVNRGLLLELNSEAELAAVLGHEIVHAAARHGAKGIERQTLLKAGVAAAGIAASNSDYGPLLAGAAGLGANLINQKYGRDQESESDFYGMRYMSRAGYDPKAAIALQETFVRLSEGKNTSWLEGLFASHPPSQGRVEANRKTAAELPPGGVLAEADYRRGTKHIRETAVAYNYLDEGREALEKGDSAQALALADKALAIEPREATFLALKADALSARGDDRAALQVYEQAAALNGEYYAIALGKGETERRLGLAERSRESLERANALLPTAQGMFGMGELALQAGNEKTATDYFRQAAQGEGGAGKAAGIRLARLDLPGNPGNYIKVSPVADGGRVVARIRNDAAVAVKEVVVELALVGQGSKVLASDRLGIRGPIAPGASVALPTRLVLPAAPAEARYRVVAAKIAE